MKKFASMRKGFTLVELLIVIVVIGILSAMMMLSSSETVSTAKATVIIANMRNLKTAALAYFADNPHYIYSTPAGTTDISNNSNSKKKDEWAALMGYLNGSQYTYEKSYKLISSRNGTAWYVECSLSGRDTRNGVDQATPLLSGSELVSVKKKLANRAKSIGLLAERYNSNQTARYYNGNDDYIFLLVQ